MINHYVVCMYLCFYIKLLKMKIIIKMQQILVNYQKKNSKNVFLLILFQKSVFIENN